MALLGRTFSLVLVDPRLPDWLLKQDGQTNLMPLQSNPNSIIIEQLTERLKTLEASTNSDVVLICAPIRFGLDSYLRDAIEAIPEKKTKISVVLETTGGLIEVTERMAQTLRQHYTAVDFIIPDYAYSAGTVLAMSGDAIYMDYFSVLGPIDPQLEKDDRMVPALGYLEQYNRLIAKSIEGGLSTAEMAILVNRFDTAELYMYEQAKELSISLLKQWLVQYKFKNWNKTETRKKTVTKAMREARAQNIATLLNEIRKWNSHGRGISMQVLRRDLELVIEDFGQSPELNAAIKDYHKLLKDFQSTARHMSVIHTREEFMSLGRA